MEMNLYFTRLVADWKGAGAARPGLTCLAPATRLCPAHQFCLAAAHCPGGGAGCGAGRVCCAPPSGILVTGGFPTSKEAGRGAELLVPAGPGPALQCRLADLPETRTGHSQQGGLVCGGGLWRDEGELRPVPPTTSSCTNLVSVNRIFVWRQKLQNICELRFQAGGAWARSHSLSTTRDDHVGWQVDNKTVILLGGGGDPTGKAAYTTEILTEHGDSAPGFPMKYPIE